MKEKPILFSGLMVRALLEGRKTQTRRVVKPMKSQEFLTPELLDEVHSVEIGPDWLQLMHPAAGTMHQGIMHPPDSPLTCIKVPWHVGHRLWVKETFMEVEPSCCDGSCGHKEYAYRATEKSVCFVNDGDGAPMFNKDGTTKSPWKPSIFCTRAASRINLEITGIRVERLNDISEADAIAEGIDCQDSLRWPGKKVFRDYGFKDSDRIDNCEWMDGAKNSYRTLWESINGPGSWALNPWVWVVEFKVVEGGQP